MRNVGGIDGGGVFNAGELVLTRCVIENGVADRGGGIWNRGTVSMTGCAIRGNRSLTEGGGIMAKRSNAHC